eukprot:maker-scaffold48_size466083-snap-gene-1.20 protein:Tk05965 transcript:maker-scaffold48_size466083-snap-gene-1.20-mRNA-1 annotation:"protein C10 "
MAFEPEFTVVDAKSALIDLLNAYQGPKYQPQLEALRGEAGDDMIKQMQIVFPVVAKIQAEVIHRYGFSADGEGVIQFMQHIKLFEREDPEIARLFSLVKSHSIPPMDFR